MIYAGGLMLTLLTTYYALKFGIYFSYNFIASIDNISFCWGEKSEQI